MAPSRLANGSAAPLVPERPTLAKLREAAAGCKACDLWKRGTQTVFGEGGAHAEVILVGEQPGNDEDLAGRPFVGPAGKLLDVRGRGAGAERASLVFAPRATYVTRERFPRERSSGTRTFRRRSDRSR